MSTKVRLQATVEIEVGTWGSNGGIAPLTEQAVREGKTILNNALRKSDGEVVSIDKVILITHDIDLGGKVTS